MLCAGEYAEPLQLRFSKARLGHHPFHGMFDDIGGLAGKHRSIRDFLHTAHCARMVTVNLLGFFVSGDAHFLRVDNNNAISRISESCKCRLMFAAEDFSDFASQPAKGFSGCIKDKPGRFDFMRFSQKTFLSFNFTGCFRLNLFFSILPLGFLVFSAGAADAVSLVFLAARGCVALAGLALAGLALALSDLGSLGSSDFCFLADMGKPRIFCG